MRFTAVFVVALLSGCGSSPPPTAPSVPASTPPATKAAAPMAAGEIYAVDWPMERRAELELAMKEHVAILAHDGESVRVLGDCKLDGRYASASQPLKEDVVRLETFAEVKRTLVFTAAKTAGRLEAEMSKGAVVEIAVAVAATVN